MRKTLALAVVVLVMLTAAPTRANQPVAKDVLRADDGSVVVGTTLATKDDVDTLRTEIRKEFTEVRKELAEIRREIAAIQAWGAAVAFFVMLTTPILTVVLTRKFGTPHSYPQENQGRLFNAYARNAKETVIQQSHPSVHR